MSLRVQQCVMYNSWPDPQGLDAGLVVSLNPDASMRPARRDDPPGHIVGITGGGGMAYSIGGTFQVDVNGPMRMTRPPGFGDVPVDDSVVAVNMALTVSSSGDGRLVLSGAAGDPVIGRVVNWDGKVLSFRLQEPTVSATDLPFPDPPKVVVKPDEGVDQQVVAAVSLKVDGGPVEWDF